MFVDKVAPDGKREAVALTPQYAEMKLGTLRGLVEGTTGRTPPRNPFEPSKADAIARSDAATRDEGDKDARIKAAEKLPAVRRLAQQTGRDVSVIAAEWIKNDESGAAAGGVS